MALELDLYTLFSTDATIFALMNGQNNVWLGAIRKGESDSIALVIQTTFTETLAAAESVNSLRMKRMQFDSYAVQYSDAVALADVVRSMIQNMRGVSLANTQVQGVLINRDMDMPEEPGTGGNVFRRMLEADFWHTDGAGSVPFTPIGAPVAGSNAAYIEGVPVSITPPADGQGLIYSAAQGKWVPGAISSGGINFADSETPSGVIDGLNPDFTLLHPPVSGSLQLFKNLGLTVEGIAYTRSTNTITYNEGYIPQPGDTHIAFYRY